MPDSQNELSNYSDDELAELFKELINNSLYGLKEYKLVVAEAIKRKPELRRKVFNTIQKIKTLYSQQLDTELKKLKQVNGNAINSEIKNQT